MQWRESDGVRWLEAELPGARAVFSTRLGGVSAPPWDRLNLAVQTGDRAADVATNRERLCAALGLDPATVAIGRQVHGAEIISHRARQETAAFSELSHGPPEADGHVTAADDVAPLVFVADCLPIAIAGAHGVGMLHGGWRGLAAGIVERGVEATGAAAAAVGPGIGPCCYEVGAEVIGAFEGLGGGIADGAMLDLPEVARRLLERAGVRDVELSGTCTRCQPETFFSHRGAGPRTGRQAGLVWRAA